MIKRINIIIIVFVVLFAIPKSVFAANDLFIQSCLKEDGTACPTENSVYQVEAGETIIIQMSVETEKKINGFSATIALDNLSNISEFTPSSIWNNDSEINNNTFILFRDYTDIPNNEELQKELATFKVKVGTTNPEAKITFEDIDATYFDSELNVEDYPPFIGVINFKVLNATNSNEGITFESPDTSKSISKVGYIVGIAFIIVGMLGMTNTLNKNKKKKANK